MIITWLVKGENIDFQKPSVWVVLGVKGSGKSSFLEHLAMKYLEEGYTVIDLFGSRDGEGLAWLRSPYAEKYRTLLLVGDKVALKNSPSEYIPVTMFEKRHVENFDLIISATPLYRSPEEEYEKINKVIDTLYSGVKWPKPIYIIIREAANLVYSRMKICRNQKLAKAQMLYFLRESRHFRISVGLDTIRPLSIDVDIRSQADYLVFKKLGLYHLPPEISWIYRYVEFLELRDMKPDTFIIVSKTGSVGIGYFKYHTWHKEEHENILEAIGLKVVKIEEKEKEKIEKEIPIPQLGPLEKLIIKDMLAEPLRLFRVRDFAYKHFEDRRTIQHALKRLCERGLVEKVNGKYRLSSKAIENAAKTLAIIDKRKRKAKSLLL